MKTREDIKNLVHQIFEEVQKTREAGQKEYAHDENNAFANFDRLANDLQTSREKILWVYTRKHLDGILAYINGHKSQRENVRGRIKDAIVYLILLWGMIDDVEEPNLTYVSPEFSKTYDPTRLSEGKYMEIDRYMNAQSRNK